MARTTLRIDDQLLIRLREESARQGISVSELVECALWLFLRLASRGLGPYPLPRFDGGGALVDLADQEALYRAMEGPW